MAPSFGALEKMQCQARVLLPDEWLVSLRRTRTVYGASSLVNGSAERAV
jgi:hypothetical protein